MTRIPTKSRFAFESSVKELIPSSKGNLYLWTFTFSEVISVKDGRKRWSDFLRKLRKLKKYRFFQGLRVFELHPGGHGLHVHVLTGNYLHVGTVRELWRSVRGGRIHVMPIPQDRGSYLSKYLSKSGRPECFKGCRMWASVGGQDHCKVKDVTVDSPWTRAYAVLKQTVRTVCGRSFQSLKWHERSLAVANVLHGYVWHWSMSYRPSNLEPLLP